MSIKNGDASLKSRFLGTDFSVIHKWLAISIIKDTFSTSSLTFIEISLFPKGVSIKPKIMKGFVVS